MGENSRPSAGRSRAWRYLVVTLAVLVVLAFGAGAVFQQRGWPAGHRGPLSGSAAGEDAPLAPGAVLVVGSAEVDVEGGILPLSPLCPGRVKAVRVCEGQVVVEGQALLELDPAAADAQIEVAEVNVRAAEIQREVAEQSAGNHANLVRQQAVAVAVAQVRLEAQQAQTRYAEKMVESTVLNESIARAARDLLRVAEQLVQAEKLKAEQLDRTDPRLAVRAAKAQIDLAARQLAAARQQRDALTVTAPTAGVVLRVVARQGQVLTGLQRDPAIWLRPNRPWVARCEVEQQYAGRVRPGLPCDVYDDQIDAPAWKGTVLRCSEWVGPRRNFGDDPLAWRDVRVVECLVAFDNPDDRLRVGQRVRVVVRRAGPP